jgi:hypothetical protein
MSNVRAWTDEQVAAFVDGQLDAQDTAQIQAAMRHDLTLAGRIARQRALRARISRHFDAVLGEAVPERLTRALEGKGGAATPIGAARKSGARLVAPRPLWWSAAAASVLVAALVGWLLPRGADSALVPTEAGLMAGNVLETALSDRISAEGSRNGGVLVSLSFRAGDGRYCRTFSLDSGIDGLACRTADGWVVEATGRSPEGDTAITQEYRQASSALSPSVLAAITRWQAGDALTPEEERSVREAGWR